MFLKSIDKWGGKFLVYCVLLSNQDKPIGNMHIVHYKHPQAIGYVLQVVSTSYRISSQVFWGCNIFMRHVVDSLCMHEM